jgi:hypothetical protein
MIITRKGSDVQTIQSHLIPIAELPETALPFLIAWNNVESTITVSWDFPSTSHDTPRNTALVLDVVLPIVLLDKVKEHLSTKLPLTVNVKSPDCVKALTGDAAVSMDLEILKDHLILGLTVHRVPTVGRDVETITPGLIAINGQLLLGHKKLCWFIHLKFTFTVNLLDNSKFAHDWYLNVDLCWHSDMNHDFDLGWGWGGNFPVLDNGHLAWDSGPPLA